MVPMPIVLEDGGGLAALRTLRQRHHILAWGVIAISNYSAELVAIGEARLYVLHAEMPEIQVISDSQAALAAICSNGDPISECLLVHRIRLILKLVVRTKKVHFYHCDAHKGVYGNELADQLAAKGRNSWYGPRFASHVNGKG
eukprot:539021-Amphidinium_carterae.1